MDKIRIKVFKSQLISSNMYILIYGKSVIIIDPCISKEALKYLKDKSLRVDYIILTHEHYDHISGVTWLKTMFNTRVICNQECANAIQNPNLNFSKYFDVLIEVLPKDKETLDFLNIEPYSCFADITFKNYKFIEWKGYEIKLVSTPGHSNGSICILLNDRYLFSGDSLLRDYPTITRLRGGNSRKYKEQTLKFFISLTQDTIVYPGHYESFVIKNRINKKGKIIL